MGGLCGVEVERPWQTGNDMDTLEILHNFPVWRGAGERLHVLTYICVFRPHTTRQKFCCHLKICFWKCRNSLYHHLELPGDVVVHTVTWRLDVSFVLAEVNEDI